MGEITIRPGDRADFESLLGMFDEAVAWLAERGSAGQWGTEWSGNPRRVGRTHDFAESSGLRMAELDGEAAGAIILDERPPAHVPDADEPETYIGLLITSRRFIGRGVGGRLIAYAIEEASRRGISLVRVDCWAGGDGDLVRYYESQGFKPTVRFDVKGWIGQVFEQRADLS
jgi:GNAT superfamily N-acetyltransferase